MGRNQQNNTKFQTIRKGITDVNQFQVQTSTENKSAFAELDLKSSNLFVWRVNKKQLALVSAEEHGQFYDGDSYLVLSAEQDKKLNITNYHIYLWIGNYSTIDEFTYVAFQATELDHSIFKGAARQHREVQDNESDEFLTLFKNFEVMKGGHDSYFSSQKTVQASIPTSLTHQENTFESRNASIDSKTSASKKIRPKLFHIRGNRRRTRVIQVSYKYENLNSEDVFIIDHHPTYYQFNGSLCNEDERNFAVSWLEAKKQKKQNIEIIVIDESTAGRSHLVINSMPRKNKIDENQENEESEKRRGSISPKLFKLSDEKGKIEFKAIPPAKKYKRSMLCPDDIYILDTGKKCFVWVGKGASLNEKTLALVYTTQYLATYSNPFMPIETTHDGAETAGFMEQFV